MQKIYSRINWENEPSVSTPLNEDNLNKIDYALDQVDTRVVNLYGYEERVAQSEVNAKTSETNAKVSEINAKESEVKAKEYMESAFKGTPEGYQEFLDKVDALEIKTTKERTNKGTKHGGFRLTKMLANTEQKKLSGKNLAGVIDREPATWFGITSSVTNGIFKLSGTADASGNIDVAMHTGYMTFKDNTTYTISLQDCEGSMPHIITAYLQNGSTGGFPTYTTFSPNDKGRFDIVDGFVCDYVLLRLVPGTTIDCSFRVQIEEGEEKTPIEEFCGGMASPNPSFPQPLLSTGDCVEFIQGAYSVESGNFVTATEICNKNTIPCKSGDVVKVVTDEAYNICLTFYNENAYMHYDVRFSATEGVFTIPSGATHFNINIAKDGGVTPQTAGKITLTINGKYLGCAKTISENFFGGLAFVNALKNSGADVLEHTNEYVALSANANIGKFVYRANFKENTRYTVFIRGYNNATDYPTVSNLAIYYTDGTKSYILFNSDRSLQNVQVSEEGKTIDYISGVWYGGLSYIYYDDFGVMEGVHTLEDFKPYKETVAYYLTQYPMIKGSTLFRENGLVKVEHTKGLHIFNYIEGIGNLGNGNAYVVVEIPNKIYSTTLDIMCNRAILGYGIFLDGTFYENEANVVVVGSASDTLETMKAKYEGAEFLYTLATPIVETLDTASQIALNSSETFDGMTIVEFDTRVQPLEIEAEVGTSQMGAYTLKSLNNSESNAVKIEDAINTMLLITP